MKYFSLVIIFALLLLSGCKKKEERVVLIKTDYGNMKVRLYDETPLHRDNFIKLTEEGFFNGTLFHRVIKDFMIQGGDPDSKNANPGQRLGNGGPGYKIPAEMHFPELFHKKGVIAAAREGDRVNPEKMSSGSQFYIVQGKKITDEQLDKVEAGVNAMRKQQIRFRVMSEYKGKLLKLQQEQKFDEFTALQKKIQEEVDKEAAQNRFVIPENIRDVYKTIGGTPHLDSNYTVFGEVIEGLNVIDSIAAVQTDRYDRPVKDVRMTIEVVK